MMLNKCIDCFRLFKKLILSVKTISDIQETNYELTCIAKIDFFFFLKKDITVVL